MPITPAFTASQRSARVQQYLAQSPPKSSPGPILNLAARSMLTRQHPQLADPQILEEVEELFIAGGGGAGRALPSALTEAAKYGLDLKKVKSVCATSVGTIMALAITLEIPLPQIKQLLEEMPAHQFQEWDWWTSLVNFPYTWGWCKGKAMPEYFRQLLKNITGLEDPTFAQLKAAGYRKDLRVVTANLDRGNLTIFSAKETPHQKVADAIALSCSVPLLFPPQWISSADGTLELHADGGVLQNYPYGVGSDQQIPLHKQLGFVFVNGTTARALDGEVNAPIRSFLQYFLSLIAVLIFQHPLTLSEPIKRRTVAIQLNHNPFQFSATQAQQQRLDEAGAQGVRNLVAQIKKHQHQTDAVSPVAAHFSCTGQCGRSQSWRTRYRFRS